MHHTHCKMPQHIEEEPTVLAESPLTSNGKIELRSPNDAILTSYVSDCAWFRDRSPSSQTIRRRADGEFNEPTFSSAPTLYVLVIQSAPGFHMLFPIFRGSPHWDTEQVFGGMYAIAANDGVIHTLVDQCKKVGGFDQKSAIHYRNYFLEVLKAVGIGSPPSEQENGGEVNE